MIHNDGNAALSVYFMSLNDIGENDWNDDVYVLFTKI